MARLPKKIRKRDNSLVGFDKQKIERAIFRAALEALADEKKAAHTADVSTEKVLERVTEVFKDKTPSVEEIQDIVEEVLMQEGLSSVARSYILYREEHQDIRQVKVIYGVRDDLKLPLNTLFVLKKRYLLKDDEKNIVETPRELFRRIAGSVSEGEANFKSKRNKNEVEEKFFRMMTSFEFLPNSPTLMNAGTSLGQLSACFVLPVEDSIEGIFGALKNMAKIHQTGGGTGFDFSRLRPKGDLVSSTKGEASGPVSFMSIFNQATGVIVQGGRRRGANMGILRCDHPDIVDFIEAKIEEGAFSNFNLSVGVTDGFMDAVRRNSKFDLVNPRTRKTVKSVKARVLFDLIVYSTWRTGDPGLIFLDEINRRNPTPRLGRIEATNPCGEIPLLPNESCNLASVNLSKFVRNGSMEWDRLEDAIEWGVRFLDDVIEVNSYPLPQIQEMTFANRKIGLGVMGFADMLIKLGIPYNQESAVRVALKVMKFVRDASLKASQALARERGVFPNHKESIYPKKNMRMRNATVNTVAPTGTISIIAGCSSGIEPLFALSFVRNVLSGRKLYEIHSLFEEELRMRSLYSKELLAEVGKVGSIRDIKQFPADIRKVFVTAFDVPPKHHLRIQAAFQKYTDNSVSKTINLPFDSTVEDVRKIYLLAHELKCKGITIYRYDTKKNQVLAFDSRIGEEREELLDFIMAESEYAGGCPSGMCPF
ncbi:MAG: adenosylcobalamin-dependent ribonucleoside-diphosphate reductase [Candidatus Aminicenantes bacterium]|nr:MAG: adenosylcobalamin-dependent ribonucleoside-diphosphate reductase [Candidatus Aminicenantes bacterium]